MNRKGLALSAALLITVGAVSAIAAVGVHHRGDGDGGWHQSHKGKGHGFHRGGKRHGKMGRMIRLKQRDADNDGTVTLDEFLKPRADKFAKIDANGDGMLDGAELTARMRERSGQRQRMMMARLDVDGDGQVTMEEFEKSAGRLRRGKRGRCGRGGYRGHGDRGRGMGRMGDEAGMDRDRGPGKRAERRAERQAKRFARMDANGDGVITAADLEARSAERIGWFRKKTERYRAKSSWRGPSSDLPISISTRTARSRPPICLRAWPRAGKRSPRQRAMPVEPTTSARSNSSLSVSRHCSGPRELACGR
jgi:hypothetical protein